MTTISLEGLASNIEGEERALAYIKVEHNGQTYDWQMFIPANTALDAYIAASSSRIGAEIDKKEAEWAALDPKTREIEDPITGEVTIVPIEKSEIVRPDVPDYYAKRRAEYPTLGDQLDALWKGGEAMANMMDRINEVKNRYPKP
jgi:hypothetical protein